MSDREQPKPHPGAIAGISSEQFAENARAIGEAYGLAADEGEAAISTRSNPDRR